MNRHSNERSELFRPEVLAYRRDKAHSKAVISQSSIVKIMVWSSVILLCLALLVLCLIRYKETETARGILQHKSATQKLKSPLAAIVVDIKVKEDEWVEPGQTLMTLSTAVLNGKGEKQQQSRIKQLKLEDDLFATELAMNKRLHEAESNRLRALTATLINTVAGLERELKLLAKQEVLSDANLRSLRKLLKHSNVSQSQFDRKQSGHISIQREQNAIAGQIREAESKIEDGRLKLKLANLSYEAKQFKIKKDRLRVAEEINGLEQESLITLTAIQEGIVSGITVKTGSPVSTGQTLLSILPDQLDLQAVVLVPSGLIGKIHTEQEILLSFDAFPITEYGYSTATVVEISAASLDPRELLLPIPGLSEPVFRVVAELDQHYVEGLEIYALINGLQFSAEFVKEDLSLFEFIFKPVLKLREKIL